MKNKRGLGCFVIGALLLFGIFAAAGGWVWWRLSTREPRIFVQIQHPQDAGVVNINDPLPLVVFAEADEPIARLEVYADGVLIAASNGDGQNTAVLSQTWMPSTAGRHVLVARAFLSEENFADSQITFVDSLDLSALPIQVNVNDLPRADGMSEISVSDLAAAAGTTPEEIARLNPGLVTGGTAPSGASIAIPRHAPAPGGSAPVIPPPAPGAPGSATPTDSDPNFDGETHSCSQIAIRWTDSPNETSYNLYRVAPGEDMLSLLASLPANTLSYVDAPVTRIGTYRYFLAPIRAGVEGLTSMLAIEITPDCSPAGSATTNLRLSLLSLTAQERYDGMYCYVSINGSRYERIPAGDGLIRPTSGDLLYDLPLQLSNRGQYAVSPTSGGLVMLEGECWGRRGVESLRVGRFAGNHASGEWDGRDLTTELAFEPLSVASLSDTPPAAGGANFLRYRIGIPASITDISSLHNGVIQIPSGVADAFRADRPAVPSPTNLRLVNRSLGLCADLPAGGDPNIGTLLCEEQIIRNLAWDWNPTAEIPQSDITGFMVITSIQDTLSTSPAGEGFSNSVSPGTARSSAIPDYSIRWRCGATVRFTVRAISNLGMSAPSEAFEVRMPACRSASKLIISVDSLTISPSALSGEVLDQGDICVGCSDRRLELYGMMTFADGHNSIGNLNPPGHGAGTILFGLCPSNTICHNEGTFTTNSGWAYEMDYLINDRPLVFTVAINDYDTENSPDLFCVAMTSLAPRSPQEWSRVNETVILQSDFGEAKCRFQLTVRGQVEN